MSKRKPSESDNDEVEEETPALVDVHFDYYAVNAENDYHAVKRLVVQLFGPDADKIEPGALTEAVLSAAAESGVGSTIKTEEEEDAADADPYAVLTVVGWRTSGAAGTDAQDRPGLGALIEYVRGKTGADPSLADTLGRAHVGLVLSERLVNMPVQVMGPMYAMLADELDAAVAEGRDYAFTHFLFLSRVYRLEDEQHTAKRHKSDGVRAFHPEDDAIIQHATHTVTYDFTEPPPAAGVQLAGRAMLVPAAEFRNLVRRISESYPV